MDDLCMVCRRPCLPGQDLLRCIPHRVEHTGKRQVSTDADGDFSIHQACLDALTESAAPTPDTAPGAPRPEFEMPDVLDFLA
jgi:hypothetical protein